ncbi:MAG: PilZ domain-containing protein [Nitrospirae bacterium]|nr:PilZ domain-containing protein [Nitrospirota bacterium]
MFTKRKHPRFSVSGVAIVKVPEKEQEFLGPVEMISQGGAGIYTDEKIEKGTSISLVVDIFTGSNTSTCNLTGVVKNFVQWNKKGLLGVQFDKEINSKDQPQIYQYLTFLEKQFITEYKPPI